MDLPGLTATTGPRHPLQRNDRPQHGREQIQDDAFLLLLASRAEQSTLDEKIAFFATISRGYAAASLWSPMYSSVSILLAPYHGLEWTGTRALWLPAHSRPAAS